MKNQILLVRYFPAHRIDVNLNIIIFWIQTPQSVKYLSENQAFKISTAFHFFL